MLLVRMRLVVYMFVCLFVITCLFVCLFVLQAIYVIGCWEGEVHYCCLKSYGIFYCSNVWWDHIPDANCTGVKGEHCTEDAAPGGDVMATVF